MYSSLRRSLSLRSLSSSATRLISQQDLIPKLDRRKGFSGRATAAMFTATVINFLLSSLYTGSQVATFIISIREALVLDIDYPLSEKPALVNNALRNVNLVTAWSVSLSVSIELLPPDSVSIHARWRCCSVISLSFGGLGPSFKIDRG